MPNEQAHIAHQPGHSPTARDRATDDYPVREYICHMTSELARMARWDGDEALAVLLESACARAAKAG